MLRFKFHQNCTINENFDFWGVKGGLTQLQGLFIWRSFTIINNKTFVRKICSTPNILYGGPGHVDHFESFLRTG